MKAEQGRVDELARQFFAIVSKARGISVEKIEGFQAGIFLGAAAVKAGLSDGVLSWERFVKKISLAHGAQTRTHSAYGTSRPSGERTMPLNIDALIAKKTAALAAEQDPDKRLSLAAELHSAKKTKKEMDDEDECEPGSAAAAEAEEEEEERKKKAKKAKAEADAAALPAPHPSTLARTVAALTGETDEARMVGALQGLVDKAGRVDALQADVEAIKNERKRESKESAITSKLRGGYITAGKADWLRSQSLDVVTSYLATCTSKLYNIDGDEKLPPAEGKLNAEGLDEATLASIEEACRSFDGDKAVLRTQLVAAHKELTQRTGAGSH